MGRLEVASQDVTKTIEPGERLSFGRAPNTDLVIGLDPVDSGISRTAGEFVWSGDRWWLVNSSATRSLEVVDSTRWPRTVAPKGTASLDDADTLVIVTGAVLRHALSTHVEQPPPREDSLIPWEGETTTRVLPTYRERRALTALCEGFLLDWPHYRPLAASYEEAGRRADLDASTVRKRIERFRDKLVDHVGVELGGGDYRLAICRFVLTHRLITGADLECLDAGE